MALMLVLGLSLVALSSMLALRAVSLGRTDRRRTLAQIGAYGFVPAAQKGKRDADDGPSALEELAEAAGEKAIARFGRLQEREKSVRRLLNSAGYYQRSPASFIGARILATLPGAALLFLLSSTGALNVRLGFGTVIAVLMGWFFPLVRMQREARLRLERIDREVPELVDLLVTTVEAGVGFAAALQLAARSIEGPLGQELRVALREQSLGLTPEEALRNLAGRVDSPATRALTQALVQGESLGVSIGQILRDLAVDMRKRRRQQAEERAQKTPTKILFPLIGLILPAMFIVALGPVLLEIVRFLGSA